MFCGSKSSVHPVLLQADNMPFSPKIQPETLETGPSTRGLEVPLCSCLQMGMQTATSQSQFLSLKHRDCQRNVLWEHLLLTQSFLYLSFTCSLPGTCLQSLSKLERSETIQVNDPSFLKRKTETFTQWPARIEGQGPTPSPYLSLCLSFPQVTGAAVVSLSRESEHFCSYVDINQSLESAERCKHRPKGRQSHMTQQLAFWMHLKDTFHGGKHRTHQGIYSILCYKR